MEIKYYIFFLGTGMALLLAVFAALSEKLTKWVFAGFLLSTMYMIDINFMSHEWYRGSTRGFEFSITDLLLIVLLGSVLVKHFMGNEKGAKIVWAPEGSFLFLLFIAICALSLTKAEHPLYGLFELVKLGKGYLIFWSVCNIARNRSFRDMAFWTLCLLAVAEVAYGAFQHFSGRYRIPGTLSHPNSYAMYLNLLLPILFAAALRVEWKKGICLLALVGGGTGAVILTFSRGGWIALVLAIGVVIILSFRQEFSMRSFFVVGLSMLISLVLVLKALPLMLDRWSNAPIESLYSRLQMNQSGYLMVSQSPWLGVGLNNSAAWFAKKEKQINREDLEGTQLFNKMLGSLQLSEDKLEKEIAPFLYAENGILIHNIYLVTAAETGIIGLIAYVLMGARFFLIGGFLALQKQEKEKSFWIVGIFAGIAAVYLQGIAEWGNPTNSNLLFIFHTIGNFGRNKNSFGKVT